MWGVYGRWRRRRSAGWRLRERRGKGVGVDWTVEGREADVPGGGG